MTHLWRAAHPLVLASKSAARRGLLEAAGIPVIIEGAAVDERSIEAPLKARGSGGREIAATGQGGGRGYNARSMSQATTTAPAPISAPATESFEQGGTPLRVILVTGLSGAGHSTALRALEDLGYEAVDNLPLALLNAPASFDRPVALGIDSRTAVVTTFAARVSRAPSSS